MRNRHIIITRPLHQSAALAAELEQQRATVTSLPLLTIEAKDDQQFPDCAVGSFDWAIFTSANAVRCLADQNFTSLARSRIAVIGPGTAAALSERRRSVDFSPARGLTSEQLVAQLPLKPNDSVLIVTGEGGRGSLAKLLGQTVGHVALMPVYRRRKLALNQEAWLQHLPDCDAVVISSGEALQHLVDAASPAVRELLFSRQLVAPSKRVVQLPACAHFELPPWLPDGMSNAAIVDLLSEAFDERNPKTE